MNYTILINKEHKITPSQMKKISIIKTKNEEGKEIEIEIETQKAYQKLKEFLKQKEIYIEIDSAYRSFTKQQKMQEEEPKNKNIAQVGYSEHHTGLALDLTIYSNNHFLKTKEEKLKQESIYKKIHQELSNFGFILRYPKGKEEITKYPYSPWHIRYVGKTIAKIMEKNNYTLEEYHQKFSGIIVVNKEKGPTSFDIVKDLSNFFGIKKIGHTGTLDPLAEGVLVVTIGSATKIAELLTANKKVYQAGVILGVKTDTLDITGKILKSKKVDETKKIEPVLKEFNTTYLQEVPLYSAVKVKGKKLYEYARKNESVELPKKQVTIENIHLLSSDRNTFIFECLVSKGCYIRSLIRDIGIKLNTDATMTMLKRIKQGKFSLEDANTIEEIKEGKFKLYKIEEVLDYPIIKVENQLKWKIQNGQKLSNQWQIKDKVIFKDQNDQLLGIYEVENYNLKTWKNFTSR